MTTRLLYYDAPYTQDHQAQVTGLTQKGPNMLVTLDDTIFYPEGGGQPSDQGEIVGTSGRIKVELVQIRDGQVVHQGKIFGALNVGESVRLALKWTHRHHYMRVHSAGHLIHDVLMTMTDQLVPVKGSHSNNAYLEYTGAVSPDIKEELSRRVNEAVRMDLPISMRVSSPSEISAVCKFVPPNLPGNKELRIIQIGDFSPMPDGGVQVKSTSEIGAIVIQDVISGDNKFTVKYRVTGAVSH